ncbi:alpha-glucuronidase family glycosyl hydrolase [Cyclobacterium lianum]|nr:alpha-glucuronidase family glycosyl hydrolase [Cyclobacterium lianum]
MTLYLRLCTCLLLLLVQGTSTVFSKDGYKLWLQYHPLEAPQKVQSLMGAIRVDGDSPTLAIIKTELQLAANGFLDKNLPLAFDHQEEAARLIISKQTPSGWDPSAKGSLGREGYRLLKNDAGVVWVAADTDIGLLYGTFKFLQLMQTGAGIPESGYHSEPKIQHRILNHWDNLNRTLERGYAGASIWNWHRLPDHIDQQYHDYARANASIGINGSVVTNVNANALVLTPEYLEKAAALADVFRPYGITLYLTARFSAPMELGRLPTADPLDPGVQQWWKDKADEIYRYIPDFGGFLVKADSEGQPGPHNYQRSQADGANLLADALKPHGGIVMWRAFVYSEDTPDDRAKQAYQEFQPYDGSFRDNVIVQVKNGAIDFQPREPFHPLFGAMPQTPLMMEFQITQEYLGQATHHVFLPSLYTEVLQSDTYVNGPGSTVSKVIDGSLHGYSLTAMAGVSNIGTDRNWTGHHFHQANWFGYGRLAWDPEISPETIADEWLRLTFTNAPEFIEPVKKMMLQSHEMAVNYMTPLGLHHIMAWSHHYGPGPWVTDRHRDDWTSTYYHKASENGVGFDRTASGSNALEQYAPELQAQWGDPKRVPEKYLLWFHHVPWEYTLQNGRTLWDEMALRYQKGVDEARQNVATWESLESYVDEERHAHVFSFLEIQAKEAAWWRDACLLYFQQFAQSPLPEGVEKPEKELEYFMGIRHRYVPGN